MRLSSYLPVSPLPSLSKGSKKVSHCSKAMGDLSDEELSVIICELAQHLIELQVCEHVLEEEFILPLAQLSKGPLIPKMKAA